jgi:hypothetical protein
MEAAAQEQPSDLGWRLGSGNARELGAGQLGGGGADLC